MDLAKYFSKELFRTQCFIIPQLHCWYLGFDSTALENKMQCTHSNMKGRFFFSSAEADFLLHCTFFFLELWLAASNGISHRTRCSMLADAVHELLPWALSSWCSRSRGRRREAAEGEEEEENWLYKQVYAALAGMVCAYTEKCSNISLCLSAVILVES